MKRKQQKPAEYPFRFRKQVLTARESQVLKRYAKGHSYQEIGDEFGISGKTVGTYIQRIREKLRARTRADLVAKAAELAGKLPMR